MQGAGRRTVKDVDGLSELNLGAQFDLANLGQGSFINDEVIDVCIYNHASSRSGLTASFVSDNRRRLVQRKERCKRLADYPANRVGSSVEADLKVNVLHKHGSVGPEGRALLFPIDKRRAQPQSVHNVSSEAKGIQQQVLKAINRHFHGNIPLVHRMVVLLAT